MGRALAARSSPAAGRSWSRFICGAAMRFMSMTASMATSATPEPLAFASPRVAPLGEATEPEQAATDFVLFGPTCDSADRMRGPFQLPADIREGD